MPRITNEITLTEARDELTEQLETLAEHTVQQSEDEDASVQDADVQALLDQGRQKIERKRAGVEWAISEFGTDATITVGGLTTGEFGQVEDRATDARSQKSGTATQGIVRVFQIAAGLVDAPFLDGGEDFDERARVVRELPPAFSEWLQARVNDETAVGEGNSKSFAELLAEKQDSGMSTAASSRSTRESS